MDISNAETLRGRKKITIKTDSMKRMNSKGHAQKARCHFTRHPLKGGTKMQLHRAVVAKLQQHVASFHSARRIQIFQAKQLFRRSRQTLGSQTRLRNLRFSTGRASEHFADAGVEHSNKTAFENLLCIEIFSGSGRLTATIRKLGVRSVAIDRSATRTSGPVTTLDLTKAEDLQFLKDFIASERYNLLYVHL